VGLQPVSSIKGQHSLKETEGEGMESSPLGLYRNSKGEGVRKRPVPKRKKYTENATNQKGGSNTQQRAPFYSPQRPVRDSQGSKPEKGERSGAETSKPSASFRRSLHHLRKEGVRKEFRSP